MQVGDGNQFESLLAQVFDHLLEVRKAFAIDGKGTIAVLIINVEIDYVGRDVALAKLTGDLAHARFRIIAVATLLVSQGK